MSNDFQWMTRLPNMQERMDKYGFMNAFKSFFYQKHQRIPKSKQCTVTKTIYFYFFLAQNQHVMNNHLSLRVFSDFYSGFVLIYLSLCSLYLVKLFDFSTELSCLYRNDSIRCFMVTLIANVYSLISPKQQVDMTSFIYFVWI